MHKTIAVVFYSLGVVALVSGFLFGAIGLFAGGAFAQFVGPKVEGES